MPFACSWTGPRRGTSTSPGVNANRIASTECANGWMAFPWPSSSPPREPEHCRCRKSKTNWRTDFRFSAVEVDRSPNGCRAWQPWLIGAMTCFRSPSSASFDGSVFLLEAGRCRQRNRYAYGTVWTTRTLRTCIARLIDKSLVVVENSPEEARFRMLETLREYAL